MFPYDARIVEVACHGSGQRIDAFLSYSLREWEAIPQVASEWDTWGSLERLEFVMEWPIRQDRLGQLHEQARRGTLSTAQHRKFEQLERLVAKHRPTLEHLLNGPT